MKLVVFVLFLAAAAVGRAPLIRSISGSEQQAHSVPIATVSLPGVTSKVGMEAVLKQKGIQNIVQSVLPALVGKLKNIAIPDISGEKDSIKYSVSNIKVVKVAYSAVDIDMSSDVDIAATGVAVAVTLNWSYKEKVWPHLPNGKGSADAGASNSNFNLGLTASVTPAGQLQLALAVCTVNIGDFSVKVHGSIFSWLYDIIIKALKGPLKTAISKAITSELGNLVTGTLNKILASYTYRVKIGHTAEVDFTFPVPPVVGHEAFKLGITGAVEPQSTNTPPLLPHGADLTVQPYTQSCIDLFVDQYLPNSAFYTYFAAGKLQGYVYDSMLPSAFPLRLNTSSWKLLIPELYSKYPNQAMRLFASFAESPNIFLDANQNSTFEAEMLTAFSVSADSKTWTDVFTLEANGVVGKVQVNFTSDSRLTGNIGKVSFQLSQKSSSVGNIKVGALNGLIGLVLNSIALPAINKILAKGVKVPSIDGLTFVNPSIDISTGFLRVSADLSYTPPPAVMAMFE